MKNPQGLMTYCYFLGLADAVDNMDDATGEVTLILRDDHLEILAELAKIVHGGRAYIEQLVEPGEESGARAIIAKYHDYALNTLYPGV